MSSSALHREIRKLKEQLSDRDAAIVDRDAKIERLALDLKLLEDHVKRLLSGRGGRYLVPEGQGVLFPDAFTPIEEESTAAAAPEDETGDEESDDGNRRKQRRPSNARPRRIDTSALPRVDRVHELPEDERFCPDTGLPLVPVGEKTFDEIHFERAKLSIIHHCQVVYGLAADHEETRQAKPVTAPMPPRPLEDCAASAELLAWTLVQKYANHLPLYRQEQIYEREGLRLPRQTLCDWTLGAAEALQPIVDHLFGKIRAGPVMQLDDTPVMCQGGKGESNFQAYLWTFINPEVGGVVYRFTSGRAGDLLAVELADFAGTLVGDGYSGNRAAADKVEGPIQLAGCWAHTTRKFRDARCEVPATADLFRDDIRKLYAVEREADEADEAHGGEPDPDRRLRLRQEKSRSVLTSLLTRARRLRHHYRDGGNMAKAIGYVVNQRKPLRRFLEDGRIPIDNNACERAIRPIAIGRRNWMFAGSIRGGRAAAVAYTLIECCKIAKVDMVDYLADVLVRVATHPASRIDELLPSRWARPGAPLHRERRSAPQPV